MRVVHAAGRRGRGVGGRAAGNRRELEVLTSKFYTLIPHSFGRRVPPVINPAEMLQ